MSGPTDTGSVVVTCTTVVWVRRMLVLFFIVIQRYEDDHLTCLGFFCFVNFRSPCEWRSPRFSVWSRRSRLWRTNSRRRRGWESHQPTNTRDALHSLEWNYLKSNGNICCVATFAILPTRVTRSSKRKLSSGQTTATAILLANKLVNKHTDSHLRHVSGQEERDEDVQGRLHGAEHRQSQNQQRRGRAERKPEAGSSGAGPDVTVTSRLWHHICLHCNI